MSSPSYHRLALRWWFFLIVGLAVLFNLWLAPIMPWIGSMDDDQFLVEWNLFAMDYHQRFDRDPPPGMDQWLKFAKTNQCDERRFYDLIEDDLEYFRERNRRAEKKLDYDGLIKEGSTHNTNNYIAYLLEGHNMTIIQLPDTGPLHVIQYIIDPIWQSMFEPVKHHNPPLKMKFFFNLHDRPGKKSWNAKYPAFSVTKMDYITENQPPPSEKEINQLFNGNEETVKPIPILKNPPKDFELSRHLLVPYHFNYRFKYLPDWYWPFYSKGPKFSQRRNVINWRGATTGPWMTGQRFQMIKQFGGRGVHKLEDNKTKTSVDVDFAFRNVVQAPEGETLPPSYRMDPWWQFYRQLQLNKYIMDVDGNGFTQRFPGLLRSGSVVFKSTQFREWFHGIFQPYRDYIPVNFNLSDLVEKVAWADAHPHIMEKIIEHSREQSFRYHRKVDMQCYVYRLVLEYQTLFEPI